MTDHTSDTSRGAPHEPGAPGGREGAAAPKVDLPAVLIELGVPSEQVDRAVADGSLSLLAFERLVSLDEARFDLAEVAALSGIEPTEVRAYWRALGFPDPRPGEKVFSDADVELLDTVATFIAQGALEPELALQMARVIGNAVDKVATAQVDALESRRRPEVDEGDGEVAPGGDDVPPVPETAKMTVELVALVPRVMEYVWRRQLANAARRRMTGVSAAEGDAGMCVGFADLVGFTAQTQQLSESELAEVVGRFEAIAYDVVAAHGGRVVKLIGDEVMFLHDDIRQGAELALTLAESYRDDEALSDVRVGLASGPVLQRDGDVYGHVVNLASRIVTIAYPATVVVSKEIADLLRDDEELTLRSIRSHYLKDIGRTPLWTMRRSDDTSERPYRWALERRAARREFLRERRDHLRAEARELTTELPEPVKRQLSGTVGSTSEPTTGQFEALVDAMVDAELELELEVGLLADIEAARRLHHLELEAQAKADEADLEAEKKLDEIEAEARRRVEEAEREARRRVDQALTEAEDKSRKVNEEASRKVQRVAEDAERKAERAEKEAKARIERDAKKRKRKKNGD